METFKKKLDSDHYILLILAVIFFFVYLWFDFSATLPALRDCGRYISSWPDAMANHFFISEFVKSGKFAVEEPLNLIYQNIIHPRSVNIVNNDIVPMGFLGMLIIYSWIGKLIGVKLALFLTPLLAVLGVLSFYGIIKTIFNKRLALIAAFLLFSLAPFWYYANLSMLSNGLFISLLLIGVYFFIRQTQRGGFIFSALSGIFIGLALITRYIEIVWFILLMIVPLYYYLKRKLNVGQLVIFIACLMASVGVLLFYNYQIYGEIFTAGYLNMNNGGNILERLPTEFHVNSASSEFLTFVKLVFIPFGFSPKIIALNFLKYFVLFASPYIVLALSGAVLWIIRWRKKQAARDENVFFVSLILASLCIVVFYGSWLFVDKLVLKNNTIGSSYTRYWLPLYIFMIPFAAYLLDKLLELRWAKAVKYLIVSLAIAGLCGYSTYLVYFTAGDGLISQKAIIRDYCGRAKKVESMIENNALIISDREDKLFFPDRKVIMFNLDYSIFPILAQTLGRAPVYYLTVMPDRDIDYINDKKINHLNLLLADPREVDGRFRLFKLEQSR